MRGVTGLRLDRAEFLQFLLTRLMRGVTVLQIVVTAEPIISTHTPHARRDFVVSRLGRRWGISTHTPHARRDVKMICLPIFSAISTHTPHARRDPRRLPACPSRLPFLLTRLMRGVTALDFVAAQNEEISTHTPHARRDYSSI